MEGGGESVPDSSGPMPEPAALRRFFHDLATPLSGASLHLERASRLIARGENAEEALTLARQQLERAFDLFESARAEFLR